MSHDKLVLCAKLTSDIYNRKIYFVNEESPSTEFGNKIKGRGKTLIRNGMNMNVRARASVTLIRNGMA
jgi:hypothetical protein